MSEIIHIFDRDLLKSRRSRIASEIKNYDFLLQRVAEDMEERLQTVLREFSLAIDYGSHHGLIGNMLSAHSRVGSVLFADDCPEMLAQCNGNTQLLDMEVLPFEKNSVDLICSGLSLQFVNDLPGVFVQICRALKSDGLFMAALFGGQTLYELREALAVAEEECDGGVSPRVAPFMDIRDGGALLQRAGFALPVTDSDVVTVSYESPFHLMRDLRGMGATNILCDRRKVPLGRQTLMRMVEVYHDRFGGADGRIPATFEIVSLSGWAPHESQQKPLRPGSAKVRLAGDKAGCFGC